MKEEDNNRSQDETELSESEWTQERRQANGVAGKGEKHGRQQDM